MKKMFLPLAIALLFTACSKQTKEEVTVAPTTGTYVGEAKLWGPVSCIKIEGGEQIKISYITATEIAVNYIPWGNFQGFVPFPSVTATLITKKDNVYYFAVTPITLADCRVWQTDNHTDNGVSYNIAIFPDGRIDARMSYYSYTIPQGSQYFDFSGNKTH